MASSVDLPPRALIKPDSEKMAAASFDSCSHPLPPSISQPLQPLTPQEIEAIKLVGDEDSRNWSYNKKWSTTIIISVTGFISPLGSSIVVPGSMFIDRSFHLHSRTLSILPVSVFVLGLGVGPFILAPWSETQGRHPVYVLTGLIFVFFNIGCALSRDFVTLNVLRFMAGAMGSTGPSLGAGSIGDMFDARERGRAQSLYGLGPLMGPVLGNLIGGFIAQGQHDWHWLLWTLAIISFLSFLIIVIFLRETFAPVLLQRKRQRAVKLRLAQIRQQSPQLVVPPTTLAGRIRNLVHRWTPTKATRDKLKLAQSRPFRLLFTNPICAIFSIYLGFCYGIIFLFLTQHPLLFQRREHISPDEPSEKKLPTYGWTLGISGLSYLGLGFGFILAAFTNVLLQDCIYSRLALTDGHLGWYLFMERSNLEQFVAEQGHLRYHKQQQQQQQQLSPSPPPPPHYPSKDVEKQTAAAQEHFHPPPSMPTVTSSDETTPSSTPSLSSPLPSPPPCHSAIIKPKKGRPEYRLPLCFVGMLILPCGLLCFGWSAENRSHWMVPLTGSFIVGYTTILCFQTILVYLVDAFVPFSASATACAVLVRSILAAAFPLFAGKMFQHLGYGWSCSLLALIALLGAPVPLVLYRYGESLRMRYKFQG